MISRAVKRACKQAGVKKFVFHNYRNTALTEWSRQGVHVDIAMRGVRAHQHGHAQALSRLEAV